MVHKIATIFNIFGDALRSELLLVCTGGFSCNDTTNCKHAFLYVISLQYCSLVGHNSFKSFEVLHPIRYSKSTDAVKHFCEIRSYLNIT